MFLPGASNAGLREYYKLAFFWFMMALLFVTEVLL